MSQKKTVKVVGTPAPIAWLLVLFAILAIVCLVIFSLVIYPQYQMQRHYQAGVAFQQVADWEKAVQEFEKVILLNPDYKDVQTRFAEVKAKASETSAAATATTVAQAQLTQTAAVVATANELEAHYQKALAYMNMGRLSEAKQELEIVLATDPNYKDVQAKLVGVEATLSMPTLTPTYTASPTRDIKTYHWVKRNPSVAPTNRGGYGLVFDRNRKVFVLFGGNNEHGEYFGDTWEWDGSNWNEMNVPNAPSPRDLPVMAYNSNRGVVILLGGGNSSGYIYHDLWEYDGVSWKEVTLDVVPPSRLGGCYAVDETNGLLIMFGGDNQTTLLNDTWTFDGSTWTEHVSSTSPSPRVGCSMAYDAKRNVVVLFGGEDIKGVHSLNDTWEWTGEKWIERDPAVKPPNRLWSALIYHPILGKALLFGGDKGACTTLYEDTWSWDGENWEQLSPGNPGQHSVIASAYDPFRDAILLFGGWAGGDSICWVTSETWEFVPETTSSTPSLEPSLQWLGFIGDEVGSGNTVNGDGNPDGVFLLTLPFPGKVILHIRLETPDGYEHWDTDGEDSWILGVVDEESGQRLHRLGILMNYFIADVAQLELYAAVSESGFRSGEKYNVVVTFEDGSQIKLQIQIP